MGKREKKISLNLTIEQFNMLEELARLERRPISELAALILCDNVEVLFLERQQHGEMKKATFTPRR